MFEPEHVESALHHPGECMFGGGAYDLIDTKMELLFDGRAYVGREAATLIGKAAGLVDPQALAAVEEERDRIQGELDAATELLAEAQAKLEEADKLRDAIAFTLERGAVLSGKNKELSVTLRHKPGMTRIDLARELVIERVTAAADRGEITPDAAMEAINA